MNEEQKRVVIITGGSGGIGRSVAKRLASDGFAIALHYAGNSGKAEEVRAALTRAANAIVVRADVSSDAEVEGLFNTTTEAFGRIDVVVHTAGIMPLFPIECGDVESSTE